MARKAYRDRRLDHYREQERLYREANRDKRRRWDRESKRRQREAGHWGTCETCGIGLSQGNRHGVICRKCHEIGAAAKWTEALEMWVAGSSQREIAEAIGTTPATVGVQFVRLRDAGLPVPRRQKGNGPVRWLDPLPETPLIVEPEMMSARR